MLKFTKWPKTPGIILKNKAFSEWNQLFVGNFLAVLNEKNDDMFQFTKKQNWE